MSELNRAKLFMLRHVAHNPDITATALAEDAAEFLARPEYIEDETHWIWDVAYDTIDALR